MDITANDQKIKRLFGILTEIHQRNSPVLLWLNDGRRIVVVEIQNLDVNSCFALQIMPSGICMDTWIFLEDVTGITYISKDFREEVLEPINPAVSAYMRFFESVKENHTRGAIFYVGTTKYTIHAVHEINYPIVRIETVDMNVRHSGIFDLRQITGVQKPV